MIEKTEAPQNNTVFLILSHMLENIYMFNGEFDKPPKYFPKPNSC